MTKYYHLLIAFTFLIFNGCTQSILLLAPEDHFALGQYYLDNKNYAEATEQFQQIRDNYPLSEFSTMSQFKLAQTQFDRKHYEEAAIDFAIFLEFYPAHKLAPHAQYHLALSKYHSMLSPDRDTTIAREALLEFQKFLIQYPDHPNVENASNYRNLVRDHLFRHEIGVAQMYHRRRIYSSALSRLNPILQEIHDPILKQEAYYNVGRCYEKTRRYSEAREHYNVIMALGADHPSKWSQLVEKKLSELPTEDSELEKTPKQN